MELLTRKLADAGRALRTLEEVLGEPVSTISRDAAIQRFEYTVEVLWKSLQLFLREYEGVDCYSPKACLREAGRVGLLNQDDTVAALEMIDERNLTSHTYQEALAERIYRNLPRHAALMRRLLDTMTMRMT